MKWLVCGGRDFEDVAHLRQTLGFLFIQRGCDKLVHGDARGADRMAGAWAEQLTIPVQKYPADWAHMGGKAGPVRNHQMLKAEQPDLVIAFPGGRGTAHMVKIAKAAGVETIVIEPK